MAISSFLTFVISSVELLGRCASYFVEHIMAISHAASFQVLTFGYSTASCSLHLVTLWRLVLLVTSHDVGCYFTPEASLRRFSSGHVHRGDSVHDDGWLSYAFQNLLDNIASSDVLGLVARAGLFFQLTCIFPQLAYIARIQLFSILFTNPWPRYVTHTV